MFKKLILIPIVLVITSGCAFTVFDAPINYQYTGTALTAVGATPPVEVGQISDNRNVPNTRMLINMTNGYGQTTSGGFQAEKELSEIVRDALIQGVAAAGLKGNGSSENIVITGELLDVKSEVVMGFIKGSVLVKVYVKLEAKNKTDNSIIWRDTFIGEGKGERGTIGAMAADGFKQSLDSIVEKVFKDQYFLQKVREIK